LLRLRPFLRSSMKQQTIFLFLLLSHFSIGQKNDFVWPMGYDGNPLAGKQTFLMDFSSNNMKITNKDNGLQMGNSNTSVCDSNGNLLFYSNGCQIYDANSQILQNGDSIILPAYKEYCINQDFYRVPDGAIALNWPDENNTFAIIQIGVHYEYQPVFAGWTSQLSYTKVDMNANNGLGLVLEKNVSIVSDSLEGGQVKAIRHGNGRDWWLIQTRLKTNKNLIYLFDSSGFHLVREQFIGPFCDKQQDFMQACFSPDGTKYAKTYDENEAWIFDFDRETGVLSNFQIIEVIGTNPIFLAPFLGLAFSPNSKYLYITNIDYLFQYDVSAPDINGSRIEIEKYTQNPVYPDYFGHMTLAPDGQIYMDVSNGSDEMHIIHNPDEQGTSCNFERTAITLDLGYFYWGLPNSPNWRLGPIDGSPCDTLGIDNIPWAHWRWKSDADEPLKIHFRDLSGFEPTAWHWDFGEGQKSADTSPTHVYASAGTYNVCEIVSNAFASDTFCRLVTVSTVSIPTVFELDELTTAPNPVTDEWRLFFKHPLERETLLRFFDVGGRLVFSEKIKAGTVVGQVSLGGLPNGLFVWNLSQNGVFLQNGRVVKVE
jgi:hypothetical protein